MRYGIIDLGSNTIRLTVYRPSEENQFQRLLSEKKMVGLAGYVEKGRLTQQGIRAACEALKVYLDMLENLEIERKAAFATASLRNVSNTDEALEAIYRETGLELEVLTGREEALLDFEGASWELKLQDGILCDVGGGSTEIVSFENSRVLSAGSIPLGSLNVHTAYVKGLLPQKEERQHIRDAVRRELKKLPECRVSDPAMCAVGGSARACLRLYQEREGKPPEDVRMETDELRKMLRWLAKGGREAMDMLYRLAPDRLRTVVTGGTVLLAAARFYGCRTVSVSSSGAREGYFLRKVLNVGGDCAEG